MYLKLRIHQLVGFGFFFHFSRKTPSAMLSPS